MKTYLAVAPNYWGRGPNPDAARRRCRQAGGRLEQPSDRYALVECTIDKPHMTAMGAVVAGEGARVLHHGSFRGRPILSSGEDA